VNEEKGGVTGSGPKGKLPPSPGTVGDEPAPQEGDDGTGVELRQGPGNYKVKYNLKQTWTCVGSDGSRLEVKKKWKGSQKMKWF